MSAADRKASLRGRPRNPNPNDVFEILKEWYERIRSDEESRQEMDRETLLFARLEAPNNFLEKLNDMYEAAKCEWKQERSSIGDANLLATVECLTIRWEELEDIEIDLDWSGCCVDSPTVNYEEELKNNDLLAISFESLNRYWTELSAVKSAAQLAADLQKRIEFLTNEIAELCKEEEFSDTDSD